MSNFVLLTPWYDAQTEYRKQENEYTLFKNLQCKQLHAIVFWDAAHNEDYLRSLVSNTTKGIQINRDVINPPKFKHLLNFAKESIDQHPGKHFIISNTDIYFDDTLEIAEEALNLDPKLVLALSRYEPSPLNQGHYLYENALMSQDCWLFSPEALEDVKPHLHDYPLGMYGSDNRFAADLDAQGFTVKNSSVDIRTYHVHTSKQRFRTRRNHADIVAKPYLSLPPVKAFE